MQTVVIRACVFILIFLPKCCRKGGEFNAYQYFIVMSGYEYKYPFVLSLLVEFIKRLPEKTLIEVNEIKIVSATFEKDDSGDHDSSDNLDGDFQITKQPKLLIIDSDF